MAEMMEWLTRVCRHPFMLWIWKTIYYTAILLGLLWIYGIQRDLHGTTSEGTFIYNAF